MDESSRATSTAQLRQRRLAAMGLQERIFYVWAGDLRTVEIAKGGHQFQFRRFIETGMHDIHGRLEKSDFLRELNRVRFAEAAGAIMGDVFGEENDGRVALSSALTLEHRDARIIQVGHRAMPFAAETANLAVRFLRDGHF